MKVNNNSVNLNQCRQKTCSQASFGSRISLPTDVILDMATKNVDNAKGWTGLIDAAKKIAGKTRLVFEGFNQVAEDCINHVRAQIPNFAEIEKDSKTFSAEIKSYTPEGKLAWLNKQKEKLGGKKFIEIDSLPSADALDNKSIKTNKAEQFLNNFGEALSSGKLYETSPNKVHLESSSPF